MAAYAVTTKILLVDSNDSAADSVTGSAAKTVSDYIETLDLTTNAIYYFTVTPVSNSKVQVMIVHK